MCSRFWNDQSGATFVQFLLILPLLLALSMGIIDLGMWIMQFNLAAKATHLGARLAVVSNPVAENITTVPFDYERIGDPCVDTATGLPIVSGGVANCPDISTTCIAQPSPSTTGTCPGFNFDNEAFVTIYDRMSGLFPRISRENVQISYRTTGLGFVGRPGGLPMTVTVSLRCMTFDFFFIDNLFGWAAPANTCGAGFPAGWPIPASRTTLTSEDLACDPAYDCPPAYLPG